MKLSERTYLAARGALGCSTTHNGDYKVYTIDCRGEFADCDISAYSQTLGRLAALEFDVLYPGHPICAEQRGRPLLPPNTICTV